MQNIKNIMNNPDTVMFDDYYKYDLLQDKIRSSL
jgi:hypothetical protein